jgi:hypothetical protein
MKKLTVISFGLLFLFINTNEQSYDTTQYYGKMNYVFQYIDKGQITTGFLRDYGIEFLNLDNYQGTVLHDSNYVALDDWRLLYTSLYSSQINGNVYMPYLDTVNRLIPANTIIPACLLRLTKQARLEKPLSLATMYNVSI